MGKLLSTQKAARHLARSGAVCLLLCTLCTEIIIIRIINMRNQLFRQPSRVLKDARDENVDDLGLLFPFASKKYLRQKPFQRPGCVPTPSTASKGDPAQGSSEDVVVGAIG